VKAWGGGGGVRKGRERGDDIIRISSFSFRKCQKKGVARQKKKGFLFHLVICDDV
jgi:hypothetical protein